MGKDGRQIRKFNVNELTGSANISTIGRTSSTTLRTSVFVYFLSVVTANYDINTYFGDFPMHNGKKTMGKLLPSLGRGKREEKPSDNFRIPSFSCANMANTEQTPFVVILLYRAEGRFVGMGSIINRKTVLSAAKAVELTMQVPSDLICLAGRMGPWWGDGSQIKRAEEIYTNDKYLALINLRDPFVFNRNVAPIKVAQEEAKDYAMEYTTENAIFGITRSSWDVPGDVTAKTSRYMMKIESLVVIKEQMDECKTAFPDHDLDLKAHICTFANGTFCWGCIGSPTIAVATNDELLQIAVVTKTTALSDSDIYHVHTKVGPYAIWLKSHSHLDYAIPGPVEDNPPPPPPPTTAAP